MKNQIHSIKGMPRHYCRHFQCSGWHPEKYSKIVSLNTWHELIKELDIVINNKLHHIIEIIAENDFKHMYEEAINDMAEKIAINIDREIIDNIIELQRKE